MLSDTVSGGAGPVGGDGRQGACSSLDARVRPGADALASPLPVRRVVRLVTYNVHGCVGSDGVLSPHRVAEAIAEFEPDLVALQELDVKRPRSQRLDQPAIIAATLRMDAHFAPAFTAGDAHYGNAVLSRFPMSIRQMGPLPGDGRRVTEPRGAMWVSIDLGDRELHIINTHLGLSSRERAAQADELLGERWLERLAHREPAVLCGDFNALPFSGVYRTLRARLRDAQRDFPSSRAQSTYPARWPAFRIDHIFVSEGLTIERVGALATRKTRLASDHLPLMATLVLP